MRVPPDCQVFLSYRRSDAGGHARALRGELVRRLGEAAVFFDQSSIESGDRFDHVLRDQVTACRVLIALIGPDWLDVADDDGEPRLSNPNDFVRQEIALALARATPIIPVLFDNTPMPAAEQLPDELKALALHDALTLRGKTYEYERHIDELIRLLRQHAPDLRSTVPSLVRGYETLFETHELFAGRHDELAQMTAFIAEQDRGHLFISGRSASGKTALMANWVRGLRDRDDVHVAYHFISAKLGTTSEADLLRSLAQQLSPVFNTVSSIPTALDELRVFYATLIESDPPSRPVVIVIDALDEADTDIPWHRHIPRHLGPRVFFAFSARTMADVDWLDRLRLTNTPSVESLDLDARSLRIEDVRELLRTAGERSAALAINETAVAALTEQAADDPLLLRFLVDDIATGTIATVDDLRQVPKGFENYLRDWWKSISKSAAKEQHVQQLLGYLVAARGWLTRDDIIAIDPDDSLDGFSFDDALEALQRFVLGNDELGYVLCHPRFQDYVAERVLANEHRYRERILDYCARWPDHQSRYALGAYASHLIEEAELASLHPQEHTYTQLVDLLTNETFQTTYMNRVSDFGALHRHVKAALHRALALGGTSALQGAIRLGLSTEALRERWLDPHALFEAATRGDPHRAEAMLALFGPDPQWRSLSLTVFAWLASKADLEAGRRYLLEHAHELAPGEMWYSLLPERLRANLDGTAEPEAVIPFAGPFNGQPLPDIGDLELARALVARMGGQLSENPSAFNVEGLRAGSTSFSDMDYGSETPMYVTENDGPPLVAIAANHPAEGMDLLQEYIAIHGENPYEVYRNRSLYGIAGAAICYPDLDTAMALVQNLIGKALQSGGTDYTEPTLIALTTLRAANGDPNAQARLDNMHSSAQNAAAELLPERGLSDSWGHHCRRLAMLAEAHCLVFGDDGTVNALLEQAHQLPFGYAGFQAPAKLLLADAFRICRPGDTAVLLELGTQAVRAAHKVQEPPFCAITTARVNAMLHHWWHSPVDPIGSIVDRFHQAPDQPNFSALHLVGEAFIERSGADEDTLPIPDSMRNARSLSDIAKQIFALPTQELVRVNPALGWDTELDRDMYFNDGTPVNVPDPGFAPLLAARLSAEVIAERDALGGEAPALLVKLLPAAATNMTTLHLVLGRLLLSLGPGGIDALDITDDMIPNAWLMDLAKPPDMVPN